MSVHHQTMQAAFLDADQVRRGPLPEVVSMEPILQGVPFAHEKTVFDGADGFFAIWACGAGVFPRVKDKRGSFMYIISGDATIVDEDGTSHELTADSVLVLPFGWVGTWHIRQTIRKVYLHTTPVPPLPTTVVASAFRPAGRVLRDRPPVAAAAPGSLAGTDAVIFDGPDGRCDIRSREPGQYSWAADEHGFFAFVLAGDGFLVEGDGTRRELTPGSVIALPSGWSGTWDIRRTLRAFCVRSTPPLGDHEDRAPHMSDDDPYAAVTPAPALAVRSDDLKHGEEMPLAYRDPQIGGTNTSPHLAWSEFPPETQSFAITCHDPDAPTGTGFMHWAVANIPNDVTALPAGAGAIGGAMPAGALTIPNDLRMRQYIGPNPPPGSGRHRYVFIVHAVDVAALEIDPDLTPVVLGFNLHFHTLARGSMTVWVDAED